MLAYTVAESTITIITDEGPIMVPRKGKRAADVIKALNAGETDLDKIRELADPTTFINTSSGQRIAIKDGIARIDGEKLPTILARRLIQLVNDGIPVDHLVKFYERLQENPSSRAVEELYTFLEHGGMPITPDGKFLAYKSINSDWTDHHTGTISNRIGNTIRMKRNLVDDNCNNGCSKGFHAGSEAYATSFGGRSSIMVLVEIDPKNVVSIPLDCGCEKMRVCEYKVIRRYTNRLPDSAVDENRMPYSTEVIPDDSDLYDEDDITVETE